MTRNKITTIWGIVLLLAISLIIVVFLANLVFTLPVIAGCCLLFASLCVVSVTANFFSKLCKNKKWGWPVVSTLLGIVLLVISIQTISLYYDATFSIPIPILEMFLSGILFGMFFLELGLSLIINKIANFFSRSKNK